MWVFTEIGFFSAVRYNEESDPRSKHKGKLVKNAPVKVMVRARVFADLQNLVELYDVMVRARVFADLQDDGTNFADEPLEILEWKGRDYPYRVIMLRETWADLLELIAGDIDYTNFKDNVKKKQGTARASMYGQVWGVLYDAEYKLAPQPPKAPQIDYYGDDNFGMGYGRSLDPRGTGDILGGPKKPHSLGSRRTPVRKGKKALHKEALADGFDKSEIIKGVGVAGVNISCSQCHALVVNGVATHEQGCPNKKSRRLSEVECGTCGEHMERVSQLKSHVCQLQP